MSLLYISCCLHVHSWPKEKAKQQTMEAKSVCKTCRKGVLFPTSTTIYRCCYCQRIYGSQPTGESKAICKGCKGEFLVPTKTTAYRCSSCQAVSTTISGYELLSQHSGIRHRMKSFGAKLFKHDQSDSVSASQNATLPSLSRSSSSSLTSRCNKRAVLCGVTYRKRKFRLKGTINDVMNMREMLVKIFEFPNECIRILTEQDENPNSIPTRKNIMDSLKWLVEDCQPGDSLVFYFSGHGLQQPDLKDDEADGFDETICPVDFMREGMIIDNDINSTIVWPLKEGVTLHAIVDACHSGTILDLMYVYNKENCKWEDNKPPAIEPMRKHTSGGLAICLSACEDAQVAADTTAFGGKGMNGVMTYLLTKAIRENPEITYGHLLEKIHEGIDKIMKRRCHIGILQHAFRRKIVQDPILSSSEKFDVFKTIFAL